MNNVFLLSSNSRKSGGAESRHSPVLGKIFVWINILFYFLN